MSYIEYRVRSGDTLSMIARRHKVTVEALARLNGINDLNRIWSGQVLRIPQESQLTSRPPTQLPTYRVRTGDTLSAIAQRNNVTVEALVQANGINDPNRIQFGQVLKIPKKIRLDDKKLGPSTSPASVSDAEATNKPAVVATKQAKPLVSYSGAPQVRKIIQCDNFLVLTFEDITKTKITVPLNFSGNLKQGTYKLYNNNGKLTLPSSSAVVPPLSEWLPSAQ